MNSWYARAIGNKVLANLVMAAVLATGLLATFGIRRESEPEVDLHVVNIFTSYPGADPEEVEEAITEKVAAAVDGLRGVKRYHTESSESSSFVSVEISDGYETAEVKSRIENAVDAIDTLPDRAEQPRVFEETDEDSVSLMFVWGDLPERQLKELAMEVRDEIQALPEVSIVELFSTREYEITVDVSEEALQQHNLTLNDVSDAIRRSSLNLSAGTLKLDTEEVRIRTLGRRYTAPEFESVVVKALPGGDVITLGRIARVRDTFTEGDRFNVFNGHPCAAIDVDRAPGEDLLKISDALDRYVAKKVDELPAGAHLTRAFDDSKFVRNQIGMLTSNGVQGLVLILLMLGLFLEPRLALWVGMGIPISLAGSMFVMWTMGWTLNQISLIGMILVLGILVDDSVVMGEAIYAHRRSGESPLMACVNGVREVALPVVASVTTTMIAFAPMLFISGIMGQFMKQMPIVVITALLVSLAECFLLFPAHLNYPLQSDSDKIGPFRRAQRRIANSLEWFVDKIYAPVIKGCVRHRYVTLCGGIALLLLTVGLVMGGIVPLTMWPPAEGDQIDAAVEFPPGTPEAVIRDAVLDMEAALRRVEANTKTTTGAPLVRSIWARAFQDMPRGELQVELLGTSERGVRVHDLIVAWEKEIGKVPGAIATTFSGATIGAGDGRDVGVMLQSKDLGALRAAAAELKAKFASYDGLYQIDDNFRPGKTELQVRLKPGAEHLGLSLDSVSRQLYAAYQGEEALTLLRDREEVKVRVRLPREQRQQISDFSSFRIRTPDGHEVPLMSVADVTAAEGVTTITGINGVRGITVSAAADRERANPTEINREIIDHYLPELLARHPEVSWSLSLIDEDNQRMLSDLRTYTILSLLAIFVILCTTFGSYIQPLLIMFIIPFGFSGAVLGHMMLGIPISFLSLAGLIALCGIIVNDSIVLIERANAYLAEGKPFHEAICAAGQRRFRAIFLTSATTVLGLGPMIVEGDLMAQVVAPMGVSIGAGLAVGMSLTLLLMPALFAILNDARRVTHRVLHGYWPAPEAVEPAVHDRMVAVNAKTHIANPA